MARLGQPYKTLEYILSLERLLRDVFVEDCFQGGSLPAEAGIGPPNGPSDALGAVAAAGGGVGAAAASSASPAWTVGSSGLEQPGGSSAAAAGDKPAPCRSRGCHSKSSGWWASLSRGPAQGRGQDVSAVYPHNKLETRSA